MPLNICEHVGRVPLTYEVWVCPEPPVYRIHSPPGRPRGVATIDYCTFHTWEEMRYHPWLEVYDLATGELASGFCTQLRDEDSRCQGRATYKVTEADGKPFLCCFEHLVAIIPKAGALQVEPLPLRNI